MTTHYIPAFCETRGRGQHVEQRSACGVWITAAEFSTEPQCEACAAWIESDEKACASLDGITPDPVPVRPEPDCVAEYHQRMTQRYGR